MRSRRAAGFGLLVFALASSTLTSKATAESAHKAKRGTPAHPARTAPDITATITKPSAPTGDLSAQDREIPAPVTLPVASRARVRACGEAWRDMKLAGTTGDDDWRDFAFKCLAGQSPTATAN